MSMKSLIKTMLFPFSRCSVHINLFRFCGWVEWTSSEKMASLARRDRKGPIGSCVKSAHEINVFTSPEGIGLL